MRKAILLGIPVLFVCSALPVWAQSTYVVDRLTDTGEGAGLNGDLRYCITNATSGLDTITFGVAGTINLTRALPALATSLTIAGPGADQLTVRRDTGGDYRIFTLTGTPTVVISGLTIANGRSTRGGGIYVAGGTVSIDYATVSNNQATGGNGLDGPWCSGADGGDGDGGLGGGIYMAGGTVSVNNSTLFNNHATGGNGGRGSSCSSPFGPPAGDGGRGGPGLGGGIYAAAGAVQVFQNTLSANQSMGGNGGDGGLGFEDDHGRGGVGGDGLGGGLFVNGGVIELQHSTFSANQVTGGGGTGGMGGGLFFNFGTLRTRNTIVAGNVAPFGTGPDISGNLGSVGHNLIGNSTGGSGFDPTDLRDVDPRLGPLQNNGGPTFTHALLPGSPAIDTGDNTGAPQWDQRGPGFRRIDIGTGLIDIGAFEVQ